MVTKKSIKGARKSLLSLDPAFATCGLDLINSVYVPKGAIDIFYDWATLQKFLYMSAASWDVDVMAYKTSLSTREQRVIMQQIFAFRACAREIIVRIAQGKSPSPKVVGEFNHVLVRIQLCTKLKIGKSPKIATMLEVSDDAHKIPAILVLSTAFLIGNFSSYIKKCANPACVLYFIDTSGKRKWCVMSMCGNRAKVRAYAKRHT